MHSRNNLRRPSRRSVKRIVAALLAACLTQPAVACSSKPDGTHPPRYELRGAEVIDHKTGLIWRRCSEGLSWNGRTCAGDKKLLTFEEASSLAKKVGKGWRLPQAKELDALIEEDCGHPPTNAIAFPDISPDVEGGSPYWSATDSGMPGMMYFVDMMYGYPDIHSTGFPLAVRLVRSAN